MWMGKAERWLDLPEGALSGEARMEMEGRRHLTVQGPCDILEYEPDRVRLHTKCGDVRILGQGLMIETYHAAGVSVGGSLLAVEFL